MSIKTIVTSLALYTSSSLLFSTNVSNETELKSAIIEANAATQIKSRFQNAISLSNQLHPSNTVASFSEQPGDFINKGIFFPGGHEIGQINVAGDFVNTLSGAVVIDITPDENIHDTIVTGNTVLEGGTLVVRLKEGNYIKGTKYVVMRGPLAGKFDQIEKRGKHANNVDLDVKYREDKVILKVVGTKKPKIPSANQKIAINPLQKPDSFFPLEQTHISEQLISLSEKEMNNLSLQPGDFVNKGIFSPGGHEIGQINVAGDFVNKLSGVVVIDITPDENIHDTIVTGNTVLEGGTLVVRLKEGNYIKGTKYVVMRGPLAGKFDQIEKRGKHANNVDLDVKYREDKVILKVVGTKKPKIPSANQKIAINPLQRPDSFFPLEQTPISEQLIPLSEKEMNNLSFELTPANYGALEWVNVRNNSLITYLISQHLFRLCCNPNQCLACGCNGSFWIDGFGSWMDNDTRFDHLSPYEAEAAGVMSGLDVYLEQTLTLGAALGYIHTWLDWERHLGHGEINTYYGALYTSIHRKQFNIEVSGLGGLSNNDIKRKIKVLAGAPTLSIQKEVIEEPVEVEIDRTAKGHPWNYFATGHVGVNLDWNFCSFTFQPYETLDYHWFHRNNFTEHGAQSLDLVVKERNQNFIRGEVGLRAYHKFVCDCFCFAPYAGGSWIGDFPLKKSKQRAHFVGQKQVFTTTSYHSSQQYGSAEAGIHVATKDRFSFLAGYKGLFNHKTTIHEGEAKLQWAF